MPTSSARSGAWPPSGWRGDRFDALMDYPLAEAILGFAGGAHLDLGVIGAHREYGANVRAIDGPAFAARLGELLAAYDPDVVAVQLNLLGSHDTPRMRSILGGDPDGGPPRDAPAADAARRPVPLLRRRGGPDRRQRPGLPWRVPMGRVALGWRVPRVRARARAPAPVASRRCVPGARPSSRPTAGRSPSSAGSTTRGSSSRSMPRTSRPGSSFRLDGVGDGARLEPIAPGPRDRDRPLVGRARRRLGDRARPTQRVGAPSRLSATLYCRPRGRLPDRAGRCSGGAASARPRRRGQDPPRARDARSRRRPGCVPRRRAAGRDPRHPARGARRPGRGRRSDRRTPARTSPTGPSMSWSAAGPRSAASSRPRWPRSPASCAPAVGCWRSTTTAATTCRACTASGPSTASGAVATGRSCAAASGSGSSTASGRSSRSRTARASSPTRSAAPAAEVGAAMTRPRLSYNVAVYHRSFDGPPPTLA